MKYKFEINVIKTVTEDVTAKWKTFEIIEGANIKEALTNFNNLLETKLLPDAKEVFGRYNAPEDEVPLQIEIVNAIIMEG